MENFFKAVKVSERVWWVGAVDWNVRNFHGYLTQRGTTYNAFLVVDEKVTLIDTVKSAFAGEMLERIASVMPVDKIDYIVSLHSEPDHSGALPQVINAVKPEKVFASAFGAKTLKAYYGLDVEVMPDGSALSLGKGELSFVETRMIHWPDSMVSFYNADGILFSQDAFGMHLAGSKLFADEYDKFVLEYEARKYFANIINNQAPKVLATVEALKGMNLDIRCIAPDHGPLFRQEFEWIFDLYTDCCLQKPKARATVIYATMWHSTEMLASAFADGVREAGVPVTMLDLNVNDRSAAMTEVALSGLVAFGTPTMNNQMFPAMADIVTYVKGLKPRNKIGFAFGSCGWSGEGAKQLTALLTEMGMEQPCAMLQSKYRPTGEELRTARASGKACAEALLAKCAAEN